jgi:hypothetical protein
MIEFRILEETEKPADDELAEVEEHCGIKLPPDFVRFYSQ